MVQGHPQPNTHFDPLLPERMFQSLNRGFLQRRKGATPGNLWNFQLLPSRSEQGPFLRHRSIFEKRVSARTKHNVADARGADAGGQGKAPLPLGELTGGYGLFHTGRLVLSGTDRAKLLICKGRRPRTCRNPQLTGRPNHVQSQSDTAIHEHVSSGLTLLLPADPRLAQRGPQPGRRWRRREFCPMIHQQKNWSKGSLSFPLPCAPVCGVESPGSSAYPQDVSSILPTPHCGPEANLF